MSQNINKLLGKTLNKIDRQTDRLVFVTDQNETYVMEHWQNCCEIVELEEVYGDLNDLIGSPILEAECIVSDEQVEDYGYTDWTFYKLATIKGSVTLRWFGSSNGCYATDVLFYRSYE